MYTLALPISLANPRFEQYSDRFIQYCQKAGIHRIFLCSANWYSPEEEKQRVLALLKKYVPIYQAAGFEVGTWINSFGHGGTCGDRVYDDDGDGLQRMINLDGQANMGSYCPLCDNLQALASDWIRRLGETGVSLIMMDDDYRYGYRGNIYCACDKHQKLLSEALGEPFDAARMKAALTTEGPNRWRDVWLQVQGQSLLDFAAMLRRALDEVNPQVRMSICTVLSTWDTDGVDALELARTFAGDTKPYLRLIGASYWAAMHSFQEMRLPSVCEYARLQQAWCKDSGIEIFCEGDPYPRPRNNISAVYVEGLDQVMRASGTCDGILKYMFDYTSAPEFEMGYYERHLEDGPLFEKLTATMAAGEAVGVTVFSPMHTFALAENPGEPDAHCIPAAIRFTTSNSLPVRYDAGDDATLIFGEAGALATDAQLAHGAVLDLTAAKALTRRGYDVGLLEVKEPVHPYEEWFEDAQDAVGVVGGCWYNTAIAPGAQVESVLYCIGPNETQVQVPGVYTYENAAGQRFCVYCFDAQKGFEGDKNSHGLFRTPYRAAQIRRILPWLSGRPLDAICDAAPDLYMLTKRDGDSLHVALWNFNEDFIRQPIVHLGGDYAAIESVEGKAELCGRTVTLDRLPAFSCACFTVKK